MAHRGSCSQAALCYWIKWFFSYTASSVPPSGRKTAVAEVSIYLLFLECAEYVTSHPRSCPGYQSWGSSARHACDPWVVWEHHGIHYLWDSLCTGCFKYFAHFEICVCWKASNSVVCIWPLAACFNIQQIIWISCIENHKNFAFCIYLLFFNGSQKYGFQFYNMVLLWVFGLITYLMSVIHVCGG